MKFFHKASLLQIFRESLSNTGALNPVDFSAFGGPEPKLA